MRPAPGIEVSSDLLAELRKGIWHCTSPTNYRRIIEDGFIRPNNGESLWGLNACQQLGGVSLLDLESPSEKEILNTADRWQQFALTTPDRAPLVVAMRLNRKVLEPALMPYEKISEKVKTGQRIPYVESCHCGNIPTNAIEHILAICSEPPHRFHSETQLGADRLTEIESEFATHCRKVMSAKAEENRRLHETFNTANWKEQLKRANDVIAESKRKGKATRFGID